MSNFKQAWAVLPMLSILSISPMRLQSNWVERNLASENVIENELNDLKSKRPLLDKIIADSKNSSINYELDLETFNKNLLSLKENIKNYESKYLKTESSSEKLKIRRKVLKSLINEIITIDEEFKSVKSNKLLSEDDSIKEANKINIIKNKTEDFLKDLELNEKLISKIESKNEKNKNQQDKKTANSKKDISKIKVSKSKEKEIKEKDDDKKNTKEKSKSDSSEEVCKHDKEDVLNSKTEKLIQDQSQIIQQMANMNQMMMMMFQQQQIYQMQQQLINQGPVNQQAYQFTPQNVGNWVYYSNGYKPGSVFPDQFGQQPAMPQYQVPQSPGPQFPAAAYQPIQNPTQGSGNWGMPPQLYFNMQTDYGPMMINPSQFGVVNTTPDPFNQGSQNQGLPALPPLPEVPQMPLGPSNFGG